MKKDLPIEAVQNATIPGENPQQENSPKDIQSFLDKFFFGPHEHGDKETNEDEDAAILQQIVGWSRME